MQFAEKIKDTLMKKDHSKVQYCNNLSPKPYQQLIFAKTLISMKMTNYLEFCFYCQKVASRKIYNKLTALHPKVTLRKIQGKTQHSLSCSNL